MSTLIARYALWQNDLSVLTLIITNITVSLTLFSFLSLRDHSYVIIVGRKRASLAVRGGAQKEKTIAPIVLPTTSFISKQANDRWDFVRGAVIPILIAGNI